MTSSDKESVFAQVVKHEGREKAHQCYMDANDFHQGGHGSNSRSIVTVLYMLSKHPECLKKI